MRKIEKSLLTAQTTPVIAFNLEAGLAGRDQVSLAWDSVRKFVDKLGVKYGFNPSVCSINSKTGDVKI